VVIRTRDDAQAALALFSPQPDGSVWLSDAFVRLSGELHIRHSAGETETDRLYHAVSALSAEHSTLLTILERNEWQKAQARAGRLDHTLWLFFASLDVEHYYVSLRSVFDHLAAVCVAAAVVPGQCPTSFDRLLTWCNDNGERAEKCLGAGLFTLVTECAWFADIRNTRDGIVHFGALTIAFPSFETISFKVYAGQRSSIVPAELMTNENIADFELFMAWTLGNLGLTLNRLASIVLPQLPGERGLGSSAYRWGFTLLSACLERLATVLPPMEQHDVGARGA
jgi:hypothetical protein